MIGESTDPRLLPPEARGLEAAALLRGIELLLDLPFAGDGDRPVVDRGTILGEALERAAKVAAEGAQGAGVRH